MLELSKKMTDLLASADIQVNGVRAWDLQVRHESFFKRVFTQGLLGLGEAYMDGWFENFDRHWPKLKRLKGNYDERFYRMWKYYLLTCAGAFRARELQLWQLVLSKHGVPGGYKRIV